MKRKKGVLLFFLVLLLLVLSFSAYKYYEYGLKAVDEKNTKEISFVIEDGMTGIAVGQKLKEKDLIRDLNIFKIYLKLNKGINFKKGSFLLKKSMDVKEIINTLTGNSNDLVSFTIKEGENLESLAARIEKTTETTKDEFLKLVNDEKYIKELITKYPFITEKVLNKDIYYSLEGYLYPETYKFGKEELSAKGVIEMSLKEMDKNLKSLNINDKIHETLTLASIIELEATKEADRQLISSVFHNRLEKGIPLQSDPTTYYGARIPMDKRDLSKNDLAKDNPYNTYNTKGEKKVLALPVGPIACPSLVSIKAAHNPPKTEWLFFLADKHGKVYYTKTNKEHEAKKKELIDKGEWSRW